MPLRHRKTNEPLIDGDKPLMVIVKGSEARLDPDAVRTALQAQKDLRSHEGDVILTEDLHRATVLQAIPHVAGFRNVELEDGTPATAADAATVLNLTKWRMPTEAEPGMSFAQQVLAFVAEADAALGNA
jgi:hypothetical protein